MDDLEAKLGAVLNNPAMMQQIMALAQNMNQQPQSKESKPQPKENPSQELSVPEFDLATLQKLSGIAKQSGVDKNQKTLLNALGPYLSRQRIAKLERAMRAAKVANMATSVLGTSLFNTGR